MASPIFVSRPHAGFSAQSFIRGIELAFLAILRSFTGSALFTMGGLREFAKVGLVSLLLNVSIDIVAKIFSAVGFQQLLSMPFLRVLEVWLACACVTSRALPEFERIFWTSLREASAEFDYTPFHHHPNYDTSNSAVRIFTNYKRRYVCMCIAMLGLAAAAASSPPLPYTYHAIYAIFFFSWFNLSRPALGTWGSLSLAMLLSTLLYPSTQAQLMSHVWSCHLLMQLLLLPYFSRASFSRMEQVMWQRARGGVLCGYGITIYALIMKFRLLGLLLIYVAEASTAILLAKVTEPLPPGVVIGTKAFSGWVARQVVWAQREEVLRGAFDPFNIHKRQNAEMTT